MPPPQPPGRARLQAPHGLAASSSSSFFHPCQVAQIVRRPTWPGDEPAVKGSRQEEKRAEGCAFEEGSSPERSMGTHFFAAAREGVMARMDNGCSSHEDVPTLSAKGPGSQNTSCQLRRPGHPKIGTCRHLSTSLSGTGTLSAKAQMLRASGVGLNPSWRPSLEHTKPPVPMGSDHRGSGTPSRGVRATALWYRDAVRTNVVDGTG